LKLILENLCEISHSNILKIFWRSTRFFTEIWERILSESLSKFSNRFWNDFNVRYSKEIQKISVAILLKIFWIFENKLFFLFFDQSFRLYSKGSRLRFRVGFATWVATRLAPPKTIRVGYSFLFCDSRFKTTLLESFKLKYKFRMEVGVIQNFSNI